MPHIIQHDNSKKSQEWYTPKYIIDATREVLGHIDLDPASTYTANKIVRATWYFTRADDGLTYEWYGNVFMNPPYGMTGRVSNQSIWFDKLLSEHKLGHTTNSISLFNVSVGSSWFDKLLKHPICFISKRIAFYDENGVTQTAPRYGNAVVYIGDDEDKFEKVFRKYGTVLKQYTQGD